jgi:hypothetical protein
MKVKLNDVINAQGSFQKLSTMEALPGKMTYTIFHNIRKLEIEIKAFDDMRQKLFEKYGEECEECEETNEKTKKINKFKRIKKENVEQFTKEVNEVLEKEIEVDIWKITAEDIKQLTSSPSASTLLPIAFMIEE